MAYLVRTGLRAVDVNELQFIVVPVLVLVPVLSPSSSSSLHRRPPYRTQHTDWKVPSVWKLRVAGAKLPSSAGVREEELLTPRRRV